MNESREDVAGSGWTLEEYRGGDTRAHFADLARLRLRVFNEFPYLYEGTEAYERRYLESYFRSEDSYAVLVVAGGRIVGAATGLPLREDAGHRRVFEEAGRDPGEVFYFGESVLEPAWRGQGIGKAFFRHREAFAATLPGIRVCAFCAIERPKDCPRRPPGYRALDGFWRSRGYERQEGLVTTLVWKDVDEESPSPKELVFWQKRL